MKKQFKWLLILLALVLSTITANAARLEKVTLAVGESTRLHVIGTKRTVKWSSSNKKVATVGKKGKVRAKSPGKAVITAKVGKKKLSRWKITVKNYPDAEAAYMKYMNDHYQEWINPFGEGASTYPFYYTLYDVDLDGVNELFVMRPGGAKGQFEIYGFDGKKVYLLNGVGGGWAFARQGANELLIGCGTGWYSDYTIYKKNGTKLVSLYTLYEENWQGKEAYKYNGSSVTKFSFDKYREQFTIKIDPNIEFRK